MSVGLLLWALLSEYFVYLCQAGKELLPLLQQCLALGCGVALRLLDDLAGHALGDVLSPGHDLGNVVQGHLGPARDVGVPVFHTSAGLRLTLRKGSVIAHTRAGVSAKGGGNGDVTIFYSTRHIEKSFAENDTAKLFFETRGVLLHELTHAYQLEPQGIGNYGNSRVFWAFIEGMADAVRVANGGFTADARPKGGNYMDGYRTAGYFFVWLRDNKDKEFLRKFNRSTLEVVPWSFNGGIKYALGDQYDIDELWHEYQVAVGDIQETK